MLAHFQFNRERLVDSLLEDVGATRRLACVTAGPPPSPPSAPADGDAPTFFCGVTIEDVPYSDGFALSCGHWFSLAAWRSLATVRVGVAERRLCSSPTASVPRPPSASPQACVAGGSTDDAVFGARCPEHGCGERIRRGVVARLLEPLQAPPGSPTGAAACVSMTVSGASSSGGSASPAGCCCVPVAGCNAASPRTATAVGAASVIVPDRGAAATPPLASDTNCAAVASDAAPPPPPPPLTPLARYQQHCIRAYVSCHPGIVSCKGPGCGVVMRRPPGAATLECPDGHRFCAARKCAAQEAHE